MYYLMKSNCLFISGKIWSSSLNKTEYFEETVRKSFLKDEFME